jgi:hypothetical protein
MAKKEYECKNCGNKVESEAEKANAPECCDTPMQEAETLPVCEASETAEHSRLDSLGEPCDDGRTGKV